MYYSASIIDCFKVYKMSIVICKPGHSRMTSLSAGRKKKKKKKNCQPIISYPVKIFFRNVGRRHAVEKNKARNVSNVWGRRVLIFK